MTSYDNFVFCMIETMNCCDSGKLDLIPEGIIKQFELEELDSMIYYLNHVYEEM